MAKDLRDLTDEELDALDRVKGYGQPAASAAPPVAPPQQSASVPSPEQRQVRQQAPIPAEEPPFRSTMGQGLKPGYPAVLVSPSRPSERATGRGDQYDSKMSGVGEGEYLAKKAGNLAAGIVSGPVGMVKGMAGQYHDAVLDAAAASPFAEYPRPEEVAQPGPAYPKGETVRPALDAAGRVLKSGAEFGAMFSPVAPLMGGYGALSGLKQAAMGEDSVARGEGLGHAEMGSLLFRHSVGKRMPGVNQAGLESAPSDMPYGLTTPEAALPGQVVRGGRRVAEAVGRIPNPVDAGLEMLRPQPEAPAPTLDGIEPGVGAPAVRGVEGWRQQPQERMVTDADLYPDATFEQAEPVPPMARRDYVRPQPAPPVQEAPIAPSGGYEPQPVPPMARRDYVRPQPEPEVQRDPGEYESGRQYTPEQRDVRMRRLVGNPPPDPVRPAPSFVPREQQGVPEQLRRDRPAAQTPQRSPFSDTEPVEQPKAKRQAPMKQKAPPVETPPPATAAPEPLMSGNTEPGAWSAPESSTVNSSAGRRLKKPKDAPSKQGGEPPFQEAPAQPGAQEPKLETWGARAFREFVKTGKVPEAYEPHRQAPAFLKGWKRAEAKSKAAPPK